MTDSLLFDSLVALRKAAEGANANAQEILQRYRRRPAFPSTSRSPGIARGQQRTAARKRLSYERVGIRYIEKAVKRFRETDPAAVELVLRATALKAPPVHVAGLSWPTAHEAAAALGEAVCEVWERSGAAEAVEPGPEGPQDEQDADASIRACLALWRRLRKLRPKMPADLWGRLQQECAEARRLLAEESGDEEAKAKRPRITAAEANLRAREALKNPKLRTARKLAKAIGCSIATVAKLPAWRAYQEGLERQGRKRNIPKAVSLTDKVLATEGREDAELERLIQDQRADLEPSPLVSHARKRRRRRPTV